MKIKLDEGAFAPRRAFPSDAGMDLFAMESKDIIPYGSATFRTGVHVELPKDTALLLVSKSGLNVKHDITSQGLIDQDYRGEIMVKLYNHGGNTFHVERGMKISQMVLIDVRFDEVEYVDELDTNTDRGSNGFGSTGLF